MRNCAIGCLVLFAMAGTACSQARAQQREIEVDLGGGVKLELIFIRNGSFDIGDGASLSEFEKPPHGILLTKSFYLGKYKVTQEQWQAVMGSNPSKFQSPKNPVESVSWDDCQLFLAKLNAKAGAQWGKFVLPTETQWEFACRAGNTTDYERLTHSTQLKDYGWYDLNSGGKTHPVGEKKPNAWGFYDMHGNVWEWCADWYGSRYYALNLREDPTGPTEGMSRVVRGGGWNDNDWACRSTARGDRDPMLRLNDLGLRVALTPADK